MVDVLHLSPKYDEKFLKTQYGKHLDEKKYIKHIIDRDTDCYDNKGNLVFKFRKNQIKNTEIAWECFKDPALKTSNVRGGSSGEIDKNSKYFKEVIKDEKLLEKNGFEYRPNETSKLRKQQSVYSTALGNFDVMKRFGKVYPCRMTQFTKRYFDNIINSIPFLEELNEAYKTLNYGKWKIQYDTASKDNWNIGDTAFTTITINRNFQTGLHVDKGDYGGWSVLSVIEDGDWSGGLFMLPKYEVGIDIRQGDVLVANVHEHHCNSPLYTTEDQDVYNEEFCDRYDDMPENLVKGSNFKFSRISFVCYCRAKINDCENKPTTLLKKNEE